MIEIIFNNRQYHLKNLTTDSIEELWQEVKRMNPNETRDKKEFLRILKEVNTRHKNVVGILDVRIPTKDDVQLNKGNGKWSIGEAVKDVKISYVETKDNDEIEFNEEDWGDDM